MITIENTKGLNPGDMVNAKIIDHDEHDMKAELVSVLDGKIDFRTF